MFLVNEGLFEHFLINKVHENVEIRGIENIQIPFRINGSVLFRTCYRMYSYVKFNPFSFFLSKILEIHKKGPGGFIGYKRGDCERSKKEKRQSIPLPYPPP